MSSASSSRATILADCGFIGAVNCDGSQEVGYFWSAALGWPLVWDQDKRPRSVLPRGGPKIAWGGPPVMPKAGKNRLHSTSLPPVHDDQQAEVDRLVPGATRIDIGQGEVSWVVMADPDGNEFCVLAPDSATGPCKRSRASQGSRASLLLGIAPQSFSAWCGVACSAARLAVRDHRSGLWAP